MPGFLLGPPPNLEFETGTLDPQDFCLFWLLLTMISGWDYATFGLLLHGMTQRDRDDEVLYDTHDSRWRKGKRKTKMANEVAFSVLLDPGASRDQGISRSAWGGMAICCVWRSRSPMPESAIFCPYLARHCGSNVSLEKGLFSHYYYY